MGDICSYHCIGFILPFLHRIPQLAFKGLLPQSLGNMAAGTLGSLLPPLPQIVIFCLLSPVFVSALSFPVTEDTFLQGASETGGGSCCLYLSVQRAKERRFIKAASETASLGGACARSNAKDNDCPLG